MRYKGYKIENTPTDKFTEMVTVIKGKTVNKKFINHWHLAFAIRWSSVNEFGLSIGSPRALLQTCAGATPKALETPNNTV